MDKSLYFSATKYYGESDQDFTHLEQPVIEEKFDASLLEIFNPIRPNDVFEIDIRPGIDPMQVLHWIRFDSTETVDGESADVYDYQVDWVEGFDVEPTERLVFRFAQLRQGREIWQIVGIQGATKMVLALRSVEENYLPQARYFSRAVIAEYGFHSDGPGPISWDGSAALLDLGDWWVNAYGGDLAEWMADEIYERPRDKVEEFVSWLERLNAVALFVLLNANCKWTDVHLTERFNEAISILSDPDSANGINIDLNSQEIEESFNLIKSRDGQVAQLLDILESESHDLAQKLVHLLELAANGGQSDVLSSDSNFVALLQDTSGED
jgi:hypothetical protein